MGWRVQRVNELIKREVGKIIFEEIEFPEETLVTVTRVETSPDLRGAKIYISVLPETKIKRILEILNKCTYIIQKKINNLLRMKSVPKIEFRTEEKIREAAKIEELLEEIKKNEK